MYIYYIYAYIRIKDSNTAKAGTPYYIGKGKGNRAYSHKNKTSIPTPKNTSQIIIMETNLSNIGACALERRYIRWFGRQDLGTGILRNKTNGGEGSSGHLYIRSKEASDRATATRLVKYGSKHKPQTILKMKKHWEGKVRIPWNKGKVLGPYSEERKQNTKSSRWPYKLV